MEQVFTISRLNLESLFGAPLPQGALVRPSLAAAFLLPADFIPRSQAEQDPARKQIIPYQLFVKDSRLFVFQRGWGVGEGRLAGRLSIGIGGHINREDSRQGIMSADEYRQALLRERKEELMTPPERDAPFLGWINDDSDPVGEVHLGAVHLCRLADQEDLQLASHEDLLAQGWWSIEEIVAAGDRFEKWSLLALELAKPLLSAARPPRLILLFNHALTSLQQSDAHESLGVMEIISPPPTIRELWARVPPEAQDLDQHLRPVLEWLRTEASTGDYVLVQGDFGACWQVVDFAFRIRLIPVYSTTAREAVEEHLPDGSVKLSHTFRHCRFRRYSPVR